MRMLSIALILIFILNFNIAYARELAIFKDFPAIGSCTGNHVRVREYPNLNSEILTRLNEFDQAIVLSSRVMAGKKWYEVELPRAEGTGWVAGEFLIPLELEGDERLINLLAKINQDFGLTPDKAKILFAGDNAIFKTEKSGDANKPYVITRVQHENYLINYINDDLTGAVVLDGKMRFGDIKLGDSRQRVIKILGEPSQNNNSNLIYKFDNGYNMFEFSLNDKGKVIKMTFAFTGEL